MQTACWIIRILILYQEPDNGQGMKKMAFMNNRPGYHVKRAQYAVRHCMDQALGEVGLSMAQYALLSALEEQPDASNADLSRACFVTPQTMIVVLKDLEAAGIVTRQPHPQNRRVITTALTPAGRSKLSAAHRVVDGVEARMVIGMTPADRERLVELLEICYTNLADNRDG
jgi:DNA-binding MarR family transcriptional regulator